MSRVLNLLLTHQEPAAVERMLDWWSHFATAADVLVAYGGRREDFDRLTFSNRVFIDDPALRTVDHPLDRQSYTAVLQQAWARMQGTDFTHVYFAEYDHLPLSRELHAKLLETLEREAADVLFHHLQRVDGTSYPHYLHECAQPDFHPFWERISVRGERRVVLTMIAPGSFWTRAAFDAVAGREEPFRIYLEIYLPTLAHHLGFRVRDLTAQNRWVNVFGDRGPEIEAAAAAGAWALHPVKKIEPDYFARLKM